MNTSKAQVKKIDRAIARGEEQDVRSEVTTLADEDRLLKQLQARQGSGTGWHLASNDPLHRLESKNHHWAKLARDLAEQMPLCHKIFKYGNLEWWSSRSLLELTDAELDSAYIYRDKYEEAVAAGKAPARPIKATDPGEEPSGGELYQISRALKEGLDRFPYPSHLHRRASILCTALKDGGTASQVLEAAFRFHEGPSILFVLAEMAAVVPEVGRLVAWLEHGEAA
ncbi:MAG: hypothetical protein JWN15_4453 [Firmicutes bacterium]|nr:hypothetical protein [Bacillota bacterium]